MTAATTPALVEPAVPPARRTDGDLALLRLPMPDRPFLSDDACSSPSCGRHGAPGTLRAVPSWSSAQAEEGTLAWYRWVLGHHAAVGVWRLLVEALGTGDEDTAADLYDGYSALLLYSGSCTPETYAAVIRARMKARHPAFTGTWARDHEQVCTLLGQRKPLPGSPLKQALKFNRLVHMTVGKRLVPEGKSLLRESGMDTSGPTDADRDRFDDFFRLDRADVCRHEFADQLSDRFSLILADLAARPARVDYGHPEIDRLQAELPDRVKELTDHDRLR